MNERTNEPARPKGRKAKPDQPQPRGAEPMNERTNEPCLRPSSTGQTLVCSQTHFVPRWTPNETSGTKGIVVFLRIQKIVENIGLTRVAASVRRWSPRRPPSPGGRKLVRLIRSFVRSFVPPRWTSGTKGIVVFLRIQKIVENIGLTRVAASVRRWSPRRPPSPGGRKLVRLIRSFVRSFVPPRWTSGTKGIVVFLIPFLLHFYFISTPFRLHFYFISISFLLHFHPISTPFLHHFYPISTPFLPHFYPNL